MEIGVAFDGSANINLPGVNSLGNQDTTGNANSVTDGVYLSSSQTITGAKTFNAATTLNSTLPLGEMMNLQAMRRGIGTTSSNYSLDIASTGDNKGFEILQSSVTGNNAQIMFSRLNNQGNDYGPEILFDKNSGADHSAKILLILLLLMEI